MTAPTIREVKLDNQEVSHHCFSVRSIKQYLRSFGRGLGSNKTLTHLNVSNNSLLPDGVKIVCNALKTCTAMKYLDLSYNSPGREPALASLLQMHTTLMSVGIVEKEPTTRSERTWSAKRTSCWPNGSGCSGVSQPWLIEAALSGLRAWVSGMQHMQHVSQVSPACPLGSALTCAALRKASGGSS